MMQGARRPWLFGLAIAWMIFGPPMVSVHAQGGRPAHPARVAGPRIHYSSQSRPPLPPQIEAIPEVQEELEVIHHRSRLIIGRNNIVRTAVADPSIVDVVQYSPNEISVIGLDIGSTTLTMWFDDRREPLIYLVNVIRDPSIEARKRIDYGKLEKKLAVLFPNSKVYLIPLSGKIIVKGQASDAEEAAKILQIVRGEVINQAGSIAGPQPDPLVGAGLGAGAAGYDPAAFNTLWDFYSSLVVNMLEVPGAYQVMLHVRIAELNRSQLRRMGIDFNVLFNDARHALASSIGGIPSTLTGIFENGEINVLVNWLASNGTIKLLSEPTLTVLSGHNASFLAGGEFPVPTIVGVDGVGAQQTTFRGFGTSLIVTPTVVDEDLVRMRIVPEFSEINQANSAGGIPGLNSRRVQTTVELREGQTIALAGLLSHQTNTEVTRIPLLGEIPKLGPLLFSAKQATQDETELLVLVTPEIVRPMEPDEVPPVPGFYVTHPSDFELYKLGMTEGVPNEGVYQLAPYGNGAGTGMEVGYSHFNPAPASPMYSPVPTNPYGGHSVPVPANRSAPPPAGMRNPPPSQYYPVPRSTAPEYAPQPVPRSSAPHPAPPRPDPFEPAAGHAGRPVARVRQAAHTIDQNAAKRPSSGWMPRFFQRFRSSDPRPEATVPASRPESSQRVEFQRYQRGRGTTGR